MDINFRRGILRIKILVSVILPVAVFLLSWSDSRYYETYWRRVDWTQVVLMTVVITPILVAGLWLGCWLIEKIGRWIIRGFTQTEAGKTK